MYSKKELKKKVLDYAYKECCLSKIHPHAYMGEFNIQALADSLGAQRGVEKYRLYEALHELSLQNIIMRGSYHDRSLYSYTLTAKGKEIAEKQLDIDEYSLRLENFVVNEELLDKCQELFNGGEYETAIFSAYRLLEVLVREKAGLTANDYGKGLMIEAFSPEKPGKLRIPTCETKSEEVGIFNLFLGAVQSFRNPTSHRIVDYENPRIALQIMVFAELLLNLVETSIERARGEKS